MPKRQRKVSKDEFSDKDWSRKSQVAFRSGEFSDLVIKCENREWKVHKIVVCCNIPFLDKTCKNEAFKEGVSGEVVLHDDDPELVDKMLCWCYSRDYNESSGPYPYFGSQRLEPDEGFEQLEIDLFGHVNMYTLANKYRIEALKDLVAIKFRAALPGIHEEDELNPQVINATVKVAETLYTATPSTDRGLRNVLLDFLTQQNSSFVKNKQFLKLFKSGLSDGDFALEVMQRWRETSKGKRFYCERCSAIETENNSPGLKKKNCEYIKCHWCEQDFCVFERGD